MQDDKNRIDSNTCLPRCPREIVETISGYIKCTTRKNLGEILNKRGLTLLCKKSRDTCDVYLVDSKVLKDFKRTTKNTKGEKQLCSILVFSGIHVARKISKRFTPMLGLLDIIGEEGIVENYVQVNLIGEKLFLYGRSVFYENIVENTLEATNKCPGNLVAVINKEGIPIGWGVVKNIKKRAIVINLLDLGWYLRSGV